MSSLCVLNRIIEVGFHFIEGKSWRQLVRYFYLHVFWRSVASDPISTTSRLHGDLSIPKPCSILIKAWKVSKCYDFFQYVVWEDVIYVFDVQQFFHNVCVFSLHSSRETDTFDTSTSSSSIEGRANRDAFSTLSSIIVIFFTLSMRADNFSFLISTVSSSSDFG